MFQFLASLTAVVLSSPKARQALRGLTVKGTIAALDMKDQLNQTIRSMKTDSKAIAPTSPTSSYGNYENYENTELTNHYAAYLADSPSLEDDNSKSLPDLEHTYAVLNDKTIDSYLPKPQ